MIKTAHIIVHGRVQGVGFRAFVQQRAQEIGVSGSVQNLPDGTVEVWAVADDDVLKEFIDWLHLGPSLSQVSQVIVDFKETNTTFVDFSILH